jgi:hypothetical protein
MIFGNIIGCLQLKNIHIIDYLNKNQQIKH